MAVAGHVGEDQPFRKILAVSC
ncbi:hypothetical protein BN126340091 [Stenotrophomonas thermophila]|nr:hypothetical protein BN126340091 [Stenotrophomonas maltophilia]